MNSECGTEDFVTFEQAKKLKELGFNWKCNHYYHLYDEQDTLSTLSDYKNSNKFDKIWSAPTLSQTQKWLREVKDIHIWVESEPNEYDDTIIYAIYIWNNNRRVYPGDYDGTMCQNTYEKAFLVGISKALKLIENETD